MPLHEEQETTGAQGRTQRADADIKDNDGNTALMLAVVEGKVEWVKLFLARVTGINSQNGVGFTALMLAVTARNTRCVELLLEHGADLNLQNSLGFTALMLAIAARNTRCVELLLEHGADLNLQNSLGYTALMLAVIENNAELVKFLLESGADVDIKNSAGNTALMLAITARNTRCVELLIECEANVDLGKNHHQTGVMCAPSNLSAVTGVQSKHPSKAVSNENDERRNLLAAHRVLIPKQQGQPIAPVASECVALPENPALIYQNMEINEENSNFLKLIGIPIKEFFLTNKSLLQNLPQAIQSLERYSPEQLGLLLAHMFTDRTLDFHCKQDKEKRARTVDVFDAVEPDYLKCLGQAFKLTLENIAYQRRIGTDTIELIAQAVATPCIRDSYERAGPKAKGTFSYQYCYAHSIGLKSSTIPGLKARLEEACCVFLQKLDPLLELVQCEFHTESVKKPSLNFLKTSLPQPNISFTIPLHTTWRDISRNPARLLVKKTSRMVSLLFEEYEASIQQSKTDEDKLHAIITLCAKLEMFHPFHDGNGRSFLVTLNLLLMQHGFLPCVFYVATGWAPVYLVTRDLSPLREGQRYFSNLMRAIENNREISPDFLPPTEQDSYGNCLDAEYFITTVLQASSANALEKNAATVQITTQTASQAAKTPEEETREVASTVADYEESASSSPVIKNSSQFFVVSTDQATKKVTRMLEEETPRVDLPENPTEGKTYSENLKVSPVQLLN